MQFRIFILFIGFSMAAGKAYSDGDTKVIRLSEPVFTNEQYEIFGDNADFTGPSVSLLELLSNKEKYAGQTQFIETNITKVCQKKGCFFIAQEEDKTIRVSFKDYEFFIPTNASGKRVALQAKLINKDLSAAQANHYNEDLNSQSEMVSAGNASELVASSVRIPK